MLGHVNRGSCNLEPAIFYARQRHIHTHITHTHTHTHNTITGHHHPSTNPLSHSHSTPIFSLFPFFNSLHKTHSHGKNIFADPPMGTYPVHYKYLLISTLPLRFLLHFSSTLPCFFLLLVSPSFSHHSRHY